MGLMRRLFEQYPWYKLIPDQSALASDPGAAPYRLVAARADDGRFALAYSPLGKAVGIHMDKVTGGKVKARWYDPREGSWSDIGEFASSGVHEFNPPSHGEDDDWVLALEDAARSQSH